MLKHPKKYILRADCTDRAAAEKELHAKFPAMVQWDAELSARPKPARRIAVRVYCRRWRGDWGGYCREPFCNLY